jgi:ribosome maturation factor RimP
MSLEETMERLVRRAVEEAGFEIVALKIDGRRHVRVWIDKDPGGVKVSDCADVNRAANRVVKEDGLEPGLFQLEVLSPGLDRLLTRPKDFERFAGQTITVRIHHKRGDRRNWKGVLVGFRDGNVFLREEGHSNEEVFRLDEIEESRLVPDLPKKPEVHHKHHH